MPGVADDAEADVLRGVEVAPAVGGQGVGAVAVVAEVGGDLSDGGGEGAGEVGWGDGVARDEEFEGDGGEGDGPGDGGERGGVGRVGVGEVEGWWWWW